MYLPLNYESERKYFYKVPLKTFCVFTVSLPLISFLTCVLLTIIKDYESANKTHCKVPNVFPSISASIGNYQPQTTIWKSAIYLHAPLRYFVIYLRWQYYLSVVRKDLRFIVNIAVVLNAIENLALLGLTYWTSSLYYPYHETCFKTFIGTSVFYMLFTCILLTKYRRRINLSNEEVFSIKMKWKSFFTNILSFSFAAYFFLRHNSICEPYVYSLFSFSEYIVVLSNIVFHMTTVYDLPISYIYLTSKGMTCN